MIRQFIGKTTNGTIKIFVDQRFQQVSAKDEWGNFESLASVAGLNSALSPEKRREMVLAAAMSDNPALELSMVTGVAWREQE